MSEEKQQDVIQCEEKDLIHFKDGLFGFEEYKKFIPLAVDEEDDSGAMIYLQSVDEEHLSFLMMNPFLLTEDYKPALSIEDNNALALEKEEDMACYVMCVIKDTPEESTVNLRCPIIINVLTRQAKQVILDTDQYGLRHALKEFSNKEGAVC